MTTVLLTAWRYRQLLSLAAKVIRVLTERVRESTPQEREEIKQHLQVICDVLREAAKRRGEQLDLDVNSLVEVTSEKVRSEYSSSQGRRSIRLQKGKDWLLHGLRKYRPNLSREEVGIILDRLKALYGILSEINRRARSKSTTSKTPSL